MQISVWNVMFGGRLRFDFGIGLLILDSIALRKSTWRVEQIRRGPPRGKTPPESGTKPQLASLVRITFKPNAEASERRPKNPNKGNGLPVLGSAGAA
jgi:hypothetical protein